MAGRTTVEQLLLFHKLERDLFHRLVHDLAQDPAAMRWVIALWLWLESAGHDDFIRRVSALPGPVVLRFVDEALACLRCLAGPRQGGAAPVAVDARDRRLPCTNALLTEPIDDVSYFEGRREALDGVTAMHKNVCLVVCDLSSTSTGTGTCVPPPPRPAGNTGRAFAAALPTPPPMVVSSPARTAPMVVSSPVRAAPMVTPWTLNPMATPWIPLEINPMPTPWIPMEEPMPPAPWIPMENASLPDDYRSLFITFSRGYPISREDITDFFNSVYGPCVETVMVERVAPGQTPVYGRVVLRSAAMIPVVLEGRPTAKFIIKGRHLWARVYVPSSRLADA